MSEDILIPEIVTSTPYEDHEQPSIRFDVKEDEETTKHLLFYKTNKKKSFSKGYKVKNKDDDNDIKTFNEFIKFINIFIPHIIINSNSETNSIQIEDVDRDITIEQLHEVFKVASKGKRKAMLDRFNEENC